MTAFFLGKRIPSSKRLVITLGFLDCVKARLDPSPFLCPQGVWLWLGVVMGIKMAQDDSVFFGVLELWLWLGDTTGIKRAQDDSVFFGKRMPSSKRLFLALGLLVDVKAWLDPSHFFMPGWDCGCCLALQRV